MYYDLINQYTCTGTCIQYTGKKLAGLRTIGAGPRK
jgi:hypothetical protein